MNDKFETSELSARERLHGIIDILTIDKVRAMLTLFQDLVEERNETLEYPNELKAQLDKDFEAYKAGEKTYSKQEVEVLTHNLLKSLRVRK